MYTVLFVDDDNNLLHINKTYFVQRGYEVFTATDSTSAMELISSHLFDCVVLDIILPEGEDGYALCNQIKGKGNPPILFLTSLTDQEFLYQGFVCGGDDYLTKPYDLKELSLRVEARIRQSRRLPAVGERLSFPPLLIDLSCRRAEVNKATVPLTGNEFDILSLLASSPEKVFATEEIYRNVWKLPDLDATHTVQVHISRMRRKLELACPEYRFIQTSWGRGYFFSPSGE